MNGTEVRNGWAVVVPEDVAADDRYSLGIGPFGSSLKVSDYTDAGVPLVFVRHIRSGVFEGHGSHFVSEKKAKELRAHEVHPGDVLITKMGDPPGDAAVYLRSRPIGIITADCIKWRISPLVGLPEYFAYATRTTSVQRQIADITQGVAQRKISLARFRSVEYPVAPLPEQHRIVEAIESYFTRLDDAVATLERVQRNLKRYRASVLKAAVEGRLVPTEAELARAEGRDYEPASVLLERIVAERRLRRQGAGGRSKYEEPVAPDTTDLPELPEGWCWATVGMLADVGTGATPKRGDHRYWSNGSVPWVTSAVAGYEIVTQPSAFVSEAALRETNLTLYPPGTLVVAMYGEGKTRGQCAELAIESTTNQALAALVTAGTGLEVRRWLKLFMAHNYDNIRRRASGGVQPNLNLGMIRDIAVPFPPLAEQARITTEIGATLSVASQVGSDVVAHQRKASRLRQSILKWAFEGRLADQDPSDEPASVLLERVRTETAAQVASAPTGAPPKRRGRRGTLTGIKRKK